MLPEPLISFTVKHAGPNAHLGWAEGVQFCLPASVLEATGLARHVNAAGYLELPGVGVRPDPGLLERVRLQAAYTERKPVSARMPFSYRRLPGWLRRLAATGIGRWQRRRQDHWARFPRWPLDLSVDFLEDYLTRQPSFLSGQPTPVILTHDLDSAEGLANLATWFLDVEEAVGAQSTNYIVPCAWPIDHGLLVEVKQRGHLVGIHGFDHSNWTPFAPPGERRRRLEAARPLVERYEVTGYRAPSLLRTRELVRDLAQWYAHDSSMPTSGGLFPVPNNGCASARPFWLEDLVELPVTLPRDGSLRFLGHAPRQIADLWISCADLIARSGGVVVLLTHCEAGFSGNPPMRDAYCRFIDHVASSPRYVWTTPDELLRRMQACKHAA